MLRLVRGNKGPRVGLILLGALQPRHTTRHPLVNWIWETKQFDSVYICDLPHVHKFGPPSPTPATDKATNPHATDSTHITHSEAQALVLEAILPLIHDEQTERVLVCSYSLGGVLTSSIWSDLRQAFEAQQRQKKRLASSQASSTSTQEETMTFSTHQEASAFHLSENISNRIQPSRGYSSDLLGVFFSAGTCIPTWKKHCIGTFFTEEGLQDDLVAGSAKDHGPGFGKILRCVREWCGAFQQSDSLFRAGDGLFTSDPKQRSTLTNDPGCHFVFGATDWVYDVHDVWVDSQPPPCALDISQHKDIPVPPTPNLFHPSKPPTQEPSPPRSLAEQYSQWGASWTLIPGDHFQVFKEFRAFAHYALYHAMESRWKDLSVESSLHSRL